MVSENSDTQYVKVPLPGRTDLLSHQHVRVPAAPPAPAATRAGLSGDAAAQLCAVVLLLAWWAAWLLMDDLPAKRHYDPARPRPAFWPKGWS